MDFKALNGKYTELFSGDKHQELVVFARKNISADTEEPLHHKQLALALDSLGQYNEAAHSAARYFLLMPSEFEDEQKKHRFFEDSKSLINLIPRAETPVEIGALRKIEMFCDGMDERYTLGLLKRICATDEATDEDYLKFGETYLKWGQANRLDKNAFREILDCFKRVKSLTVDPGLMVAALRGAGNYDKARVYINKVIEENAQDTDSIARFVGMIPGDDASAMLNDLLSSQPDNDGIKQLLEQISFRKKYEQLFLSDSYEEMVTFARENIGKEPEEPMHREKLACALNGLSQREEAIQSAIQYVLLTPMTFENREQKRSVFKAPPNEFWINNILESEYSIEPEALRKIATLCEGVNLECRIRALKKLCATGHASEQEYYQLGKAYLDWNGDGGKNFYENVLVCFEHVQSFDVERELMAKALKGVGGTDRAAELLKKTLEDKPESKATVLQLAEVYRSAGQWGAAIKVLEDWSSWDPGNEKIQQLLQQTLIFEALGAQVMAVKELAKTMDIDVLDPWGGWSGEETDPVVFCRGECVWSGDLLLDTSLMPGVGIVVDGNLKVEGSVINFEGGAVATLLVTGHLSAQNLVAGDSRIAIGGDTRIARAILGYHNDGVLLMGGHVRARYWLNADHTIECLGTRESMDIDYYFDNNDEKNFKNLRNYLKDEFKKDAPDMRYEDIWDCYVSKGIDVIDLEKYERDKHVFQSGEERLEALQKLNANWGEWNPKK